MCNSRAMIEFTLTNVSAVRSAIAAIDSVVRAGTTFPARDIARRQYLRAAKCTYVRTRACPVNIERINRKLIFICDKNDDRHSASARAKSRELGFKR